MGRPTGLPLAPSSSLPPLSALEKLTKPEILSALDNLTALYCPLRASLACSLGPESKKSRGAPLTSSFVDSGYTSETEDDSEDDPQQTLAALRTDPYERSLAERWLTGFIGRAEELTCLGSEEACQQAIDQASCVLESFFSGFGVGVGVGADEDDVKDDEDETQFTREFSFDVSPTGTEPSKRQPPIKVLLTDGLAGTDSTDPDDVGLQSWAASRILSSLMCASPGRFGLVDLGAGSSASTPRVVELGAGTGLVSIVLGSLLPRLGIVDATVVATDYHPAVLENLRCNIAASFPASSLSLSGGGTAAAVVETALLDWAEPVLEPPLHLPADMLVATDVVYAPEHAVWLRDCASRLLAPEGVFWLLIAVRDTGRFEGVGETVKAAFAAEDRPRGEDGRRLTILDLELIEKQKGIGRGDESGYRLFRIGWA